MDDPPPPDPYKALGVPSNADAATIKKTYRMLVLKTHPDKVTDEHLKKDAADRFHKIQQAYEVLADDEKRKRYDAEARLLALKAELAARGGSTSTRTDARPTYEVRTPSGAAAAAYGRSSRYESRARTYESDPYERTRPPVRSYRAEDFTDAKRTATRTTKVEKEPVKVKTAEKARSEQKVSRDKEDRKARERTRYQGSSEEEDARARYEEAYRRREAEMAADAARAKEKEKHKHAYSQSTAYEAQQAQAREHIMRDRSRAFEAMRGSGQRSTSANENARYEKVRRGSTKPSKDEHTSSRRKASTAESKPPLHESYSSPADIKIPTASSRAQPQRAHTTTEDSDRSSAPQFRRADTMPAATTASASQSTSRKATAHPSTHGSKHRTSESTTHAPVDSGYSSPTSEATATPPSTQPQYPTIPNAVPSSSKTQRYQYTPGTSGVLLNETVTPGGVPYRTVTREPDARPTASPEPMQTSTRTSPVHANERERERERERPAMPSKSSSRTVPTETRAPGYENYAKATPVRPGMDRRQASENIRVHVEDPRLREYYTRERRSPEKVSTRERTRDRERERERERPLYGEIPTSSYHYKPSSGTPKVSTPRAGDPNWAGVSMSPRYGLDDIQWSTGRSSRDKERPTLSRGATFADYGAGQRVY